MQIHGYLSRWHVFLAKQIGYCLFSQEFSWISKFLHFLALECEKSYILNRYIMDDTCVVDPRYSGSICGIYLCDFRIFESQLSGKVFTIKRIHSALTLLSFFSTQLMPTGF